MGSGERLRGEAELSASCTESSLRKKVMYAFTNPEGLNLGRQTGIHEALAGEL